MCNFYYQKLMTRLTFGLVGKEGCPQQGHVSVGYFLMISFTKYSVTGRRAGLGSNGGSLMRNGWKYDVTLGHFSIHSVEILTFNCLIHTALQILYGPLHCTHLGFFFKGGSMHILAISTD